MLDVQRDRAGDRCAACRSDGDYRGVRTLVPVVGVFMMLCVDVPACCRRYRGGLRPAGYMALLKREEKR